MQVASTHLKRDVGQIDGSPGEWMELEACQYLAGFRMGELTATNTAPY